MVVEIEPKNRKRRLWLGKRKNKHSQHLKFTNQKGGIEGGKRQKRQGVFHLVKKIFSGINVVRCWVLKSFWHKICILAFSGCMVEIWKAKSSKKSFKSKGRRGSEKTTPSPSTIVTKSIKNKWLFTAQPSAIVGFLVATEVAKPSAVQWKLCGLQEAYTPSRKTAVVWTAGWSV